MVEEWEVLPPWPVCLEEVEEDLREEEEDLVDWPPWLGCWAEEAVAGLKEGWAEWEGLPQWLVCSEEEDTSSKAVWEVLLPWLVCSAEVDTSNSREVEAAVWTCSEVCSALEETTKVARIKDMDHMKATGLSTDMTLTNNKEVVKEDGEESSPSKEDGEENNPNKVVGVVNSLNKEDGVVNNLSKEAGEETSLNKIRELEETLGVEIQEPQLLLEEMNGLVKGMFPSN